MSLRERSRSPPPGSVRVGRGIRALTLDGVVYGFRVGSQAERDPAVAAL